MELLGVGLPELFFIVIIALILLGPKDMIAAGRSIGRGLRKFVMSPEWQAMRRTGEEIQQLPTKLMREASLEELQALQAEVSSAGRQLQKDVNTATQQIQPPELKSLFKESQPLNGPTSPEILVDQPATKPEPPAAP
jgi:Sec-independent protein translocase protein TatA